MRRRFLTLLVAGCSFFAAPAAASALTSYLPPGETVQQAMSNYAAGTYTQGEANVTAQALYLQHMEAGATSAASEAYASEMVPDAEFTGSSSVADLWDELEAVGPDVGEAAAAGGGLLAWATAAFGDDGVFAALSGACVGTAGLACAAVGAVAVGGVVYALLSGGSNGNSANSPLGGSTQTTYDVGALERYWYPAVASGSDGTGCGTSFEDRVWDTALGYSSSMSGSYVPMPCSGGGVYLLGVGDTVHIPAPTHGGIFLSLTDLYLNGSEPQWTFKIDDRSWPAFSVVSYPGDDVAPSLAPSGWSFVHRYTNQPGGGYQAYGGWFEEAPAQTPVSLPQSVSTCTGEYSCSTVTTPAPSPTPQQAAQQLADPSNPAAGQVLCYLAGCVTGTGQPVPFPGEIAVPDCTGDTVSTCGAAYALAGFTGAVSSDEAGCDAQNGSYSPGDVISQTPGAGSEVDASTALTVVTNPSPACIPLPTPTTAETAASYEADLQNAGFTGTITIRQESDQNEDLDAGPDGVIDVQHAGAAVAYGTLEEPGLALTIDENPDDAPAVGGEPGTGSAPSGPTLPGIAIPHAATPCTVFPFGVPCWLSDQLAQFSTTATAPSFSMSIPAVLGGGSFAIDFGNDLFGVSLSTVMDIVRPVLLFFAAIGIMRWLAGAAGMGGSSSPTGGDE